MLWKWYLSTVWDDPKVKSNWRDPYVFCMEEERDVNSSSYVIDITSLQEAKDIFEEDYFEYHEGIVKKDGYSVNVEEMEIVVPEAFEKEEMLEWLKIAIKEIFNDDTEIHLIEGDEVEFAGTNFDSIGIMQANDIIQKMEDESGSIEQYFKEHPDKEIGYEG